MPPQPLLHADAAAVRVAVADVAREPSDAELLARLRTGDEHALERLLQRHWSAIVEYVARLTGSRDAAEDVAQRTFCRLWEQRERWAAEGALRGLLFRVARNFAIGERRRDDAETRCSAASAAAQRTIRTPLELLENQQLRRELDRAIMELPDRRREVFVLRCLHDFSYKEIAAIMGTSTQTVANQLSHALATLRSRLGFLLDG